MQRDSKKSRKKYLHSRFKR